MRDLLAGFGAFVFLLGFYLLMRCAAMDSLPQFIAACAVMVLGCVIFCAADPFFN